MLVRHVPRPEEVRFGGRHVLYVEGKGANALDPKVLSRLFSDLPLRIEPLGASFFVKSVAEALYSHHPTYYFLIDRDHHDIDFVNHCWCNFPDPDTYNLLIWRKREIENYFLEPNYLFQSRFCQVKRGDLEQKILQSANKRLFLDVANHVIISIREELKTNWIKKFSNPDDFSSKEIALKKLKHASEFARHRTNVEQKVSVEEVEHRFGERLEAMTDGRDQLAFGAGDWLAMVQGKQVFAEVVQSRCFRVQDAEGTVLQGNQKVNEIVKELLQASNKVLPADFVELKQLIDERIGGT